MRVGFWTFLYFSTAVVCFSSARADTFVCRGDTDACIRECINVGEKNGGDCSLTCFKYNSKESGYCFTKFSDPRAARNVARRQQLLKEAFKTCMFRDCKPIFDREVAACTRGVKFTEASREQITECTMAAFRNQNVCAKVCRTHATQKVNAGF